MDEQKFVELYGNAETEETSTAVMGFTVNRNAWSRWRNDLTSDWGEWEPYGNSVDYADNATFAESNGIPFNLDKNASQASGADEAQ